VNDVRWEAQQTEFVSIWSTLFVSFAKLVSSRCNEKKNPAQKPVGLTLNYCLFSAWTVVGDKQTRHSIDGKVSKVQEMHTAAGRHRCGPYRIWPNINTRPIVF